MIKSSIDSHFLMKMRKVRWISKQLSKDVLDRKSNVTSGRKGNINLICFNNFEYSKYHLSSIIFLITLRVFAPMFSYEVLMSFTNLFPPTGEIQFCLWRL